MSNIHYYVALGVGAAIALSYLKPGSSTQDLQSLTQSSTNNAQNPDTQPIVIPSVRAVSTSAVTPHSPQKNQQIQSNIKLDMGKLAIKDKETEKTAQESQFFPSPLIRFTQSADASLSLPITTSSQTTENPDTNPQVVSQAPVVSLLNTQNNNFVKDNVAEVETNLQAKVALQQRGELAIAEVFDAQTSSPTELNQGIASSVLFPNNPQAQREPLGPPLPLFLSQSKPTVQPQPPQIRPGAPAPEFLNPSANPLLFPTQSDEVQVRRTEPITLQQAIELARRNNRQLATVRLNLERAQLGLRNALAGEYPTGNVSLDFSRSDSRNPRQASPLLPDGKITSTSFNASVGLNYNLYTGGRRPALIQASEEQVRFQQLEVERISEQLRLDVTNAYYNLQQADAQVEINQAAVTDAARSLRDAELLERAGLGTQFDVLQAQVSLANANQELTTTRSQQQTSRRRIVQLLSLGQQVEVSAADPIVEAGNWDLSLEQSIVMALKNRAELEQQLVQRNINNQQRIISLAAQKPQVALSASYNILGIADDNFGPSNDFRLGASLRWNFFDAGAAQAQSQQNVTDIAIAENNFASQRNQIRLDVEQAFFDLRANRDNIQRATFALGRAEQSLRLARLRFSAGVGTQADVITQQTELTRARGSRLRAILDYNRALAAMQRAISNLPNSNLFKLQ
jgi:outer membrane protein TolC